MVFFHTTKERLKELVDLINLNPKMASFYEEPLKVSSDLLVNKNSEWYKISLIVDYGHVNNKEIDKLFDKWYVQDMRSGFMYKQRFTDYMDGFNHKHFISKTNYNKLVKLGLNIDYPLTHKDALIFLEGKSNFAIYNKSCTAFSVELQNLVNDKFKKTNGECNDETYFGIKDYSVDMAILIVNNRIKK